MSTMVYLFAKAPPGIHPHASLICLTAQFCGKDRISSTRSPTINYHIIWRQKHDIYRRTNSPEVDTHRKLLHYMEKWYIRLTETLLEWRPRAWTAVARIQKRDGRRYTSLTPAVLRIIQIKTPVRVWFLPVGDIDLVAICAMAHKQRPGDQLPNQDRYNHDHSNSNGTQRLQRMLHKNTCQTTPLSNPW